MKAELGIDMKSHLTSKEWDMLARQAEGLVTKI
jgi:hypothetical protein